MKNMNILINSAISKSIEAAHAGGISRLKGEGAWGDLLAAATDQYQLGQFALNEKGAEAFSKWEKEEFEAYVRSEIAAGSLPREYLVREMKDGKEKIASQLWMTPEGEYLSPPKDKAEREEYRKTGIKDVFGKYKTSASILKNAIKDGIDFRGKSKEEIDKERKVLKEEREKEAEEKIDVPEEIMVMARDLVASADGDRKVIYTAIARAMAE